MPEYLEVLDNAQAAVALMACELQADCLTEVLQYAPLTNADGMPSDQTARLQRDLRTLKATIAQTDQDREMWLDASNVLPVAEAIWDVDMYKADCADDPHHTYVAEKIRELGLFDIAEAYRPAR